MREPAANETDSQPAEATDAIRAKISQLLSHAPVSIDELARHAGAPPAAVQVVLLELELAGRLARHGGGLVSLA